MLLLRLPVLSAAEIYIQEFTDYRSSRTVHHGTTLANGIALHNLSTPISTQPHDASTSTQWNTNKNADQQNQDTAIGHTISQERRVDTEMGRYGDISPYPAGSTVVDRSNDSHGVGAAISSNLDPIRPVSRRSTFRTKDCSSDTE
jgi:hypothetical protein